MTDAAHLLPGVAKHEAELDLLADPYGAYFARTRPWSAQACWTMQFDTGQEGRNSTGEWGDKPADVRVWQRD